MDKRACNRRPLAFWLGLVCLLAGSAVLVWRSWPPGVAAIFGWVLCLLGGGVMAWPAGVEDDQADAASLGERIIKAPRRDVSSPSDGRPSRVEVLERERVFDDFFCIDRAMVRNELYNGQMSRARRWLVFERGDAVAVLPYDRARGTVVLVQQFRYPAHVRGDDAWLWEVIAGMQDGGRDAESVVRDEAWEEAGYRLGELRWISTVYPSAGGSSERVHLYVAPVTADSRQGAGGGIAGHEDIRVVEMPLERALEMVRSGEIMAASAIIALQYLQANWDALREGA